MAVTLPPSASVRFGLDGVVIVRNGDDLLGFPSFPLCGDDEDTFTISCSELTLGPHTVTATPFNKVNAGGVSGPAVTVSFSIMPMDSLVLSPSPSTAPSAVPAPVAAQQPALQDFQEILINCGGPDYEDPEGDTWVSDVDFQPGGATYGTETPIAGTTLDTLYQTERYGALSYKIRLPPGDYQVILQYVLQHQLYVPAFSHMFRLIPVS